MKGETEVKSAGLNTSPASSFLLSNSESQSLAACPPKHEPQSSCAQIRIETSWKIRGANPVRKHQHDIYVVVTNFRGGTGVSGLKYTSGKLELVSSAN